MNFGAVITFQISHGNLIGEQNNALSFGHLDLYFGRSYWHVAGNVLTDPWIY